MTHLVSMSACMVPIDTYASIWDVLSETLGRITHSIGH